MAIYIVAAVVLLIALLLFFRLHFYAFYEADQKLLGVRYLFIRLEYRPGRPVKPGKKKPGKPAEPEAAPKRRAALAQFRAYFDELFALVKKLTASLLRSLRIDWLALDAVVREEDAAQTAIEYGLLCSAVYPAFAFLKSNIRVKKHRVAIRPVFDGQGEAGGSSVDFCCRASIRLGAAAGAGIVAAVTFLSMLVKQKLSKARSAARAAG